MSSFYEVVGRAAIRFVRARYRAQIRAALAVGVAALGVGAYLAMKRNVPEG